MSKAQEQLAAMEALVAAVGFPDTGCPMFLIYEGANSLDFPTERVTPAVRAKLVELAGEPKRGQAHYTRNDAIWKATDERPFTINVRDWPWSTCSECGAEKPSPVPA